MPDPGDGLRLLPAGSRGLLAEVGGTADVLALHALLREARLDGVVDLVPAARTVLVVLDPAVTDPARLGAVVRERWRGRGTSLLDDATGARAAEPSLVEVPVRYDGADLQAVADLLGTDPATVVEHHTATTWVVAFCGFAPGFPYCVAVEGPAVGWQVPRRPDPRTRVPAGSVALAGPWTGVYPGPSPGGWQLLGTTEVPLWEVTRDPPALLAPGTTVRFLDVAGRSPGRHP